MPARNVASVFALLVASTFLVAPALGMPMEPDPVEPPAQRLRLGMDMPSAAGLEAAGAPAELGAIWVGAWVQTHGYAEVERLLDEAAARNITPVIHFWYWGDSIGPHCVEHGCWDALHSEHLSQEGWRGVRDNIALRVAERLQGREAIVVLESEFNKNGIDSPEYAPRFDALLAEQAERLRATPGIRVALGFGAWNEGAWGQFPRAIEASDLLAFQAMRGLTRDDVGSYETVADASVEKARHLRATFGKPVLLSDLALSSWTDEALQERALRALLARMPELQRAGVEGIAYRSLVDNPHMDPENYFGVAEQHWGLVRADGSAKPALAAWVEAASG